MVLAGWYWDVELLGCCGGAKLLVSKRCGGAGCCGKQLVSKRCGGSGGVGASGLFPSAEGGGCILDFAEAVDSPRFCSVFPKSSNMRASLSMMLHQPEG